MHFINSDTELRLYIPNAFSTLEGEPTLFDKLLPWIRQAEEQITQRLTGPAAARALLAGSQHRHEVAAAARLTAHLALCEAIPALDLVLTDRGFGVVSTDTVAPASADRVNRLIRSHQEAADCGATTLLMMIEDSDELRPLWLDSDAGIYWTSTLISTPLAARELLLPGESPSGTLLDWHATLRKETDPLESLMADRWFGEELMDAVRGRRDPEGFARRGELRRRMHYRMLSILSSLRAGKREQAVKAADSMVETIRQAPATLFPEWRRSPTSLLFDPTDDMIFKNKKNDGGYWL